MRRACPHRGRLCYGPGLHPCSCILANRSMRRSGANATLHPRRTPRPDARPQRVLPGNAACGHIDSRHAPVEHATDQLFAVRDVLVKRRRRDPERVRDPPHAGGIEPDLVRQVGRGILVGQGLGHSVNTVILAWLLLDARAVPRALALPKRPGRADTGRSMVRGESGTDIDLGRVDQTDTSFGKCHQDRRIHAESSEFGDILRSS